MSAVEPTEGLRERLLAQIAATPVPTRTAARSRKALWLGAAVLFPVVVTALLGLDLGTRSPRAVLVLAVVWSALSTLAVRLTLPWRGMVGRPWSELAGSAAAAGLGTALTVVLVTVFDAAPDRHTSNTACFVMILVLGIVPTVLVRRLRARGRMTLSPRAELASSVVAGTMLGGLVMLLHCPNGGVFHMLVGHSAAAPAAGLLAVAVAGAMGAARRSVERARGR